MDFVTPKVVGICLSNRRLKHFFYWDLFEGESILHTIKVPDRTVALD